MFNVKGRMAHLDEKDYKAGKRSDSQVASVSNKTQLYSNFHRQSTKNTDSTSAEENPSITAPDQQRGNRTYRPNMQQPEQSLGLYGVVTQASPSKHLQKCVHLYSFQEGGEVPALLDYSQKACFSPGSPLIKASMFQSFCCSRPQQTGASAG